jgi:hypothetical protein
MTPSWANTLDPVHVFGGDFSFFKFDEGDDSNLDAFAGGQYTRNQPVHDSIVRKLVNGLFGENIFSDDLRDEYGPDVSMDLSEEEIAVKLVDSVSSPAAGRDRPHQDMRIVRHGGQRRLGILITNSE